MAQFTFTAADGTSLNSLDSNWLGIGGRGDLNWEVQGNAAKETVAVVGNFEDPAGMVYTTADSDVSEITVVDAEAGSYVSPAVRCGTATNEWGYSFTFSFSAGNIDGATLERDRNFVVFQSVAGGVSALAVDLRAESTTNGSQIDVELFINNTTRGTFTDSTGSRITSLRDGSGFIAYNQGTSVIEIDAWNDGVTGPVPPVLSAPTETAITNTTATVGCTTDTGPDGTLYWFVSTSATAPSSAALKAGTGATASGSTATPSIGANTFSVTGLTAATTYYTYFIHEDTEGDSNLLESGAWSTTGGAVTYSTAMGALSPSHGYPFDGDVNDSIGSANGTNAGGLLTGGPVSEDATNSYRTNGTTDRVTLPSTATINNSAQTRKAVCGWFRTSAIQPPPKRIYGEGSQTTAFHFVMAYGNNLMLEVIEPTNFTQQVFADRILQPNRDYHIAGVFSGSGFDNLVDLYLDGVLQTNAEPLNRQPGTTDLNSRGVGEFGDPVGTVGIGGEAIILNASVNGDYQHWYFWSSDAPSATEIREVAFEQGALPGVTIASGTQAVMQAELDVIADSARPDEPLNIRVEDVTGGGDLTLSADNITHSGLASIHVQWMGAGTLTWQNTNGSDASIGSTPGGGAVLFSESVTLTVTCLDAATLAPVVGARVLLEAGSGGSLTLGDDVLAGVTNGSGVLTGSFNLAGDQPVTGRARKGSSSPYYKTGPIAGTITANGFSATVLMVRDE